jgi:hypothetical protein
MRTKSQPPTPDPVDEWASRPRHVKHPCGGLRRWNGELCESGASVERNGKWYCHRHDPDRHLNQCTATNAAGDRCGNKATVEREGVRYCYVHDPSPDPDEPRRQWEAAIEERDRAVWAAATVKAASDGVKVFLIREDVLAAVRAMLSQLPYKDVSPLMRAIAALPEAPFMGRERVMKKEPEGSA